MMVAEIAPLVPAGIVVPSGLVAPACLAQYSLDTMSDDNLEDSSREAKQGSGAAKSRKTRNEGVKKSHRCRPRR